MADLTFYTNPMSRGRIVRWLLEESGVPYDTQIIEYGDQMKSEPYIAINPMGKVPAIKHRDRVVTECAAICAYVADAFPESNLAPPLDQRADYYRWLFFAAGPFEQAIVDKSLGLQPTTEQSVMAGYGSLETTVNVLASALDGREFIAGAQFTAADVYVGSQLFWGVSFGTLPRLPAFERYLDGLLARDAYLRAQQIDGPMPS